MIDKIKSALGEELAKQVTDALNGIELGIANDGSYVPVAKYNTANADLTKAKGDLETFKADNAGKATDLTTLKAEFDTFKTEQNSAFETYKTGVESDKAKAKRIGESKKWFNDNKLNKEAEEMVLNSLDLDRAFNDEGIIVDYFTGIKDKSPSLFGEESTNSAKTKTATGENTKKTYTEKQVDAMSQDEVTANYADIRASMPKW